MSTSSAVRLVAAAATAALAVALLPLHQAAAATPTAFVSAIRFDEKVVDVGHHAFVTSSDSGTLTASAVGGGLDLTMVDDGNTTQVKVRPPTGTTFSAGASVAVAGPTPGTVGTLVVTSPFPWICTSPVSGTLTVHAATYSAGALTSFDASYVGTCGTGSTAPAFAGDVQWNASRAVAAPRIIPRSADVATGGTVTTTVTLHSAGSAPLVVGARAPIVSPVGDVAAVVSDGCANTTVPVGGSCDVTLQVSGDFAPTTASVLVPYAANVPGGRVGFSLVARRVNPPAAPTGLRAVSATDGVALTWLPPAGSSLTYRVQRSTDGSTFTDIGSPAAIRFADTTAVDGASYDYRVAALAGGGAGAWSPPIHHDVALVSATPGSYDSFTMRTPTASVAADGIHSPTPEVRADHGYLGLIGASTGGLGLNLQVRWSPSTVPAPGTYPLDGSAGVAVSQLDGCTAEATLTVHSWAFSAAWAPVDVSADVDAPTCGIHASVRLHASEGFAALISDVDSVLIDDAGVGAPSTRTLTLTNAGTTALAPSGLAIGAPTQGDAPTAGATTCAGGLAPGASCTANVVWMPAARGQSLGSLSLATDDPRVSLRWAFSGLAAVVPPSTTTLVTASMQRVQLEAGVPDDGGRPVTSVRYYSGPDADHLSLLADVPSTGTSPVVDGLVPGSTHTFLARAVNSVGEGPGTPVTVTIPTRQIVLQRSLWGATSWGLAVRAADGSSGAQALSTGMTDVGTPRVSPDGSVVAFAGLAPGSTTGWDLYTRPLAPGGALTRLTSTAGDEIEPVWSPDGSRLVFTSVVGAAPSLREMPAAGGTPTAVPNGAGLRAASWLPDGDALVAEAADRTAGLVRLTATGARSTVPGTAKALTPSVSPNGTAVAFVVPDAVSVWPDGSPRLRLRVQKLDGTLLAGLGSGSAYDLVDPSWSADSTRVRFTRVTGSGAEPWNDSGIDVFSYLVAGGEGVTRETAADAYDEAGAEETGLNEAAPQIGLTVPAWTTAAPSFAFTVGDLDDRRGSLRATCAVDTATPVPCTSPWRPKGLAPGAHTLHVAVSDPGGNTASAGGPFTVDAVAPVLGFVPTPPRTLTTPTWTIRWKPSDTGGSGLASTTLAYRLSTAKVWTSVTTTATSRVVAVPAGTTLCWTVLARDRAGNTVSPPSTCTKAPTDDRALRAVGVWGKLSGSRYLYGTAVRAAKAGASLVSRSSVSGRTIDLVVSRCATCGSVDVLVGATKVGRVSLRGKAADRLLVTVRAARTLKGLLTLRSVSAAPVAVDAVAVHPS